MNAGARRAGLAVAALAAALPAWAEGPRSAIPWLSQSIELGNTPPPPSRPAPPNAAPAPGEITVTPLAPVRRDAVGLLPPETTGFARALWGPDTTADVRALIAQHPDEGVPAARALFRRLLLAEADPPGGAEGSGEDLLLGRIDQLLAMGALEEAGALIDLAGPDTPDLFRRWFDIGILLDRTQAPCAALRQNPALSPTLPARVFCLARGGDWNAAEITLTLGQRVGSIPADEQALLARFLDPELFETEDPPPVPDPLTPLDFLMREAVGLPRPPGPLPLAFLNTDLGEHVPMRSRIEAAERLTVSGAVDYPVLFAAYRSGEPAASGGVWDRAGAVQALDAALAGGEPNAIAAALVAADKALADRGLRVALAEAYSDRLATLDSASLTPDARATAAELLLLAGAPDAARHARRDPDPHFDALVAIAGAGPAPVVVADPMAVAALAGLAAEAPADDRERRLAAMVAEGRQGRAILAALDLVQSGAPIDPQALRAAILSLRLAGQAEAARAIALQTLLAGAA
ncbi:MAG: hypothetical protein U1E59_06800 [Amaricoccus sp.]